jgi:CheY-like chemotaxis protein
MEVSRVLLVHWNVAEAKERAARLRGAGHRVEVYAAQGGEGLRDLREKPPDAVVIDLSRLPSHGRAVAVFLRQQKGTRHVPLVFVDGEAEKVARAKELLPDVTYTEWTRIRGDLARALRARPTNPVVPDTMADYSGTPLPKKLGIRDGSTVAMLGAPEGFESKLVPLPKGVRIRRAGRRPSDVVLLFAKSGAELTRRFRAGDRALADGGGLWVAWPKAASGVRSDLSQARVRAFGLARGFVDYKICAIDDTWSGLCFARRR